MHVAWIDYAVIIIYACFVLGIGFVLKRSVKSADDFFSSGRRIPGWVAGLAFLSANLGALEVMGMAANGAKYGMLTSQFYWVGAIPAMVFLGVFMMPFYYGSKARSVPEYLKMRFDERTRGLNAISFAIMTLLSSGINIYAMAIVFKFLLGWSLNVSMLIAAVVVLAYTITGGLTSSIYNEVLQFFLIVFGFAPLVALGVYDLGGWQGVVSRLPQGFAHASQGLGSVNTNPMGVEWLGMGLGLGFVLSFGYWCTDFLVVQRAMAAEDMQAARMTPLIASVPKMLFPFLVILPGLIAMALTLHPLRDAAPLLTKLHDGTYNYNMTVPLLMAHYYPSGMLGLGLTALLASFMSGMAGNVTAFNTVWTYDIYQAYLNKDGSDAHYVWMGRMATIVGVILSVAAAYIAMNFSNILDYVQLLASFFNAPIFGTFLLGMFWKRTTATGGFWGLLTGILTACLHYLLAHYGILHDRTDMATNFYGAIWAFTACVGTTMVLSLATKPPRLEDLAGLVYGHSGNPALARPTWYRHPAFWGVAVLAGAALLNLVFW